MKYAKDLKQICGEKVETKQLVPVTEGPILPNFPAQLQPMVREQMVPELEQPL